MANHVISANSTENVNNIKLGARDPKRFQFRGGYRLTKSLRLVTNRIVFDYSKGVIFIRASKRKFPYIFGTKIEKIIGKIDEIDEIRVGMCTNSFIELQKLIKQNRHRPKANFRKDPGTKCQVLDVDEFMEFYNLISYTKILDKEFKRINWKPYLDKRQFKRFLIGVQRIDIPNNEIDSLCDELMKKYEPLEAYCGKIRSRINRILSSKGFRNLLLSPECDIIVPNHNQINQDMNRPLTDYYIASSHNTYVSENQLEGRSTTETYRIYLLQGCRSVELDISDDGDDEPVVFHKHTLTTKVKLSDIVETIAKYAFKTSPYPVIISLENNCQQMNSQRKAAKIFRDGFGNLLITEPLIDDETRLPSPNDLKNKIIIKGKRLPKWDNEKLIDELENKHRLAKELSDLVWYCCSRKFTSFFDCNWNYNEMTSLEEGVSKQYSKNKLIDYRKFTSQFLTKVYPNGLRFFSGNFEPIPHWKAGAQIISLNYQTKTSPMLLNHALFETNGSCGYVLKPLHILDSKLKYRHRCCLVTIQILCALNLPVGDKKTIVDPYVEIRMFGPKPYEGKNFSTKTIRNNGLNPQWNKKFRFKVPCTEMGLTFIRFRVMHQNLFTSNRLIGQRMVAFTSMGDGYRHVKLRDSMYHSIEQAKLVVRITKTWI
ncbi:hypothetical protein RDWZM_000995 [Blomia tropicalis]|uniref:Phosphoinositide phospholipase C n=1 Tax=Blomia tropicalis TaxID=40697 RepID=A0A9Q0MAS5_BLOTA|nr:hypothetical protein RDWZM_000995 [Blomia tropicalis]